jgi:hypothetical protein
MNLKKGDIVKLAYPQRHLGFSNSDSKVVNIYIVKVLDIYGMKINNRYDFAGRVLAYYVGIEERWKTYMTTDRIKINRFKLYKSIELMKEEDIFVELL